MLLNKLSSLGFDEEVNSLDKPEEKDTYYQQGFGSWKIANGNAVCPQGCGDTSVIRFKQFSETDWDWFIMEHFCNNCMMLLEFGTEGGYRLENMKAYAEEYNHMR